MPTTNHDGRVALIKAAPELVAELLKRHGLELPEYERVEGVESDLTDPKAAEYRVDAVVVLYRGEQAVLVVGVEVQLRKSEPKRWAWPSYAARLRALYKCPACVLVLTPSDAIAKWASQTVEVGPGFRYRPVVIGRSGTPFLSDAAEASRYPELAVLSAMAHMNSGDDGLEVLVNAVHATEGLEESQRLLYLGMMSTLANDAAKKALQELREEGGAYLLSELSKKQQQLVMAKGLEQGKIEALLNILKARGLEPSKSQRKRITSCSDVEQLDTWILRAVTEDNLRTILKR